MVTPAPDITPLPPHSPLEAYSAQALAAFPHLSPADALHALARWYDFRDGDALAQFAAHPPVAFEQAVDAVVSGHLPTLQSLLAAHPSLVHARSSRITQFQPPVHRATLLHYLSANGVENFRQRTPPNAVDVALTLLHAGADPNALASCYGTETTTLSLLVSSTPPAQAGLQVPLLHTLIDHGALPHPPVSSPWLAPLFTALAFGFLPAAEALLSRGAQVTNLATAAGLGLLAEVTLFLPLSDPDTRHRALALAAQHGHTPVVELLLDAGEDPSRFNPSGNHAHSTPLHQAALAGHLETVQLLASRGARLDIPDTIYHATPLGWAQHAGHPKIVALLKEFAARN